AVTPHWLEMSDRFWYSYETRDGKRYFLVNPAASTSKGGRVKASLFDNAKMAAMLTSLSRVPMDAQHLPIKSLKFVKADTTLLLVRRRPITSSGSARTISAAGCSESRPTASTLSSSIGKRNKQERRGADGESQALYRPLPQ